VIARNSAFTYKGKSTDVKQVGRELGARYVLAGSVRKVGNRVRVTGRDHRIGEFDRRSGLGGAATSLQPDIESALQAASCQPVKRWASLCLLGFSRVVSFYERDLVAGVASCRSHPARDGSADGQMSVRIWVVDVSRQS
jgi:hypothetical protein